MANLGAILHKVKVISPIIVLKKLLRKPLTKYVNWRAKSIDFNFPTYNRYSPTKTIECGIYKLDNIDENRILELADDSLNHRFTLLGVERVHIALGKEYEGFEDIVFNPILNEDFRHDKLISRVVTQANLQFAREAMFKIKKGYKNIDWQIDFKSGFRWIARTWYKDIQYGKNNGADIKYPWELGRMQDLPILAVAFKLTLQEKYLIEFQNRIYDFISLNPPRFGVQWSSTMDISIRMVNLLVAFDIFNSFNAVITEQFKTDFSDLIQSHIAHIYNNLEWSEGMRGNHYFSNICGLLFACVYFANFEQRDEILNFAFTEFENEILYQFLDDGANFEASLPYHHFVFEMLACTLLTLNNAKDASIITLLIKLINKQNIKSRLASIFQFTINTITDLGKTPQIGDNDSGFWIHPTLLNKDQLVEDLIKLVNIDTNFNKQEFAYFKNFGLAIKRTKNYELFVKAGDVGQMGKGGHSHCDATSFELWAYNLPFICDTGTYVYTSDFKLRNEYRSTKCHNVIQYENLEQFEFYGEKKDDLFWLNQGKSNPKFNIAEPQMIIAEHSGFGFQIKRALMLKNEIVIVKDEIPNKGNKTARFHLHPDVKIELVDESTAILINKDSKIGLRIENEELLIDDYYYSPGYGIKVKSKVIVVNFSSNLLNWTIEI